MRIPFGFFFRIHPVFLGNESEISAGILSLISHEFLSAFFSEISTGLPARISAWTALEIPLDICSLVPPNKVL